MCRECECADWDSGRDAQNELAAEFERSIFMGKCSSGGALSLNLLPLDPL